MSGWGDRVGLRTPLARDSALALVLALATAGLLTGLTGPLADDLELAFSPTQRALVIGWSVAQALAVALRRVRPGLCLVLVAALQAGLTATLDSQATVRGLAPLIAFYTAGTCLPPRRLVRWAAVAVLVELVGTALLAAGLGRSSHPGATGWILAAGSVVLVYGVSAGAGVAVATRRENLALIRARAEAAERSRAADARRAVEAERLRMARELHDIAAHHLTGLLVQASAAERLVARDDEAARGALHEVRDQGKQALDNLRAVVGVLREEGTGDLNPTSGLAVLPALVAEARALGDAVDLEVAGTPYALPPVADLTAYRVTQEALSNARQHAPGQPVRVRLAYGEPAVELTVRNRLVRPPAPGPRDGFGLAGMHERAALVRAVLEIGPSEDGDGPGWTVSLRVPVRRGSR